jgi:hypothetical protein
LALCSYLRLAVKYYTKLRTMQAGFCVSQFVLCCFFTNAAKKPVFIGLCPYREIAQLRSYLFRGYIFLRK